MERARPRVEVVEDGIVRIDYGDLTAVTLDHARHTFRVRQELTGGRAVCVLFCGDKLVHYDRDAAEFAASQTVARTILAAATAPRTLLMRNLARLFLWYHRPPYACRVCADDGEALGWLRERLR